MIYKTFLFWLGLKQYYKVVNSYPLPHKIFEEKAEHLQELFRKIPFNQALVFSNLHSRYSEFYFVFKSEKVQTKIWGVGSRALSECQMHIILREKKRIRVLLKKMFGRSVLVLTHAQYSYYSVKQLTFFQTFVLISSIEIVW